MTQNLMTVPEAAAVAGVTTAAIYLAIDEGRLRGQRQYGRWLVAQADLRAYRAAAGRRNGYRRRRARILPAEELIV